MNLRTSLKLFSNAEKPFFLVNGFIPNDIIIFCVFTWYSCAQLKAL